MLHCVIASCERAPTVRNTVVKGLSSISNKFRVVSGGFYPRYYVELTVSVMCVLASRHAWPLFTHLLTSCHTGQLPAKGAVENAGTSLLIAVLTMFCERCYLARKKPNQTTSRTFLKVSVAVGCRSFQSELVAIVVHSQN